MTQTARVLPTPSTDIDDAVARLNRAFTALENRLYQLRHRENDAALLEQLHQANEGLAAENDYLRQVIAELSEQLDEAIARTESMLQKLAA
jgi:phage tail protein X